MQDFIEYIVKNLVDKPEDVSVQCQEQEDSQYLVELRVDSEDVGKVVGKKGRTINALRTIAMMASARLGYRVRIELVEV
jgi:predicted RNA-binding protein YlqC (UPF0109 family)